MLQNAYFLAKIGADTAENEQHSAEICQELAARALFPAAGARGRPELLRARGAAPRVQTAGSFFNTDP